MTGAPRSSMQWKKLTRVLEVAQLVVAISVLGFRQRHQGERTY